MTTKVSVAKLWAYNKGYCWGLGDSDIEVTLEELLVDIDHPGYLDSFIVETRENFDFNFLVDLRKHRQAVQEYMADFKAKKKVPGLELNGLAVDDGNHRLVAARYLGIKTLPVKTWTNRHFTEL